LCISSPDVTTVGEAHCAISVFHTQAVYMARVMSHGSVTVGKAGEVSSVIKVSAIFYEDDILGN
jgi:hypothetical protein